MSDSEDFNPRSHNAMFATILEKMDSQNRVMGEILIQTRKTNGRVTALENVNRFRAGWIAGVGFVGAGLGVLIGSILSLFFR